MHASTDLVEASNAGLCRLSARLTNELANAFVVEEHRYPALCHKNRDAIAHNQRLGMIDMEPVPTYQLHRE